MRTAVVLLSSLLSISCDANHAAVDQELNLIPEVPQATLESINGLDLRSYCLVESGANGLTTMVPVLDGICPQPKGTRQFVVVIDDGLPSYSRVESPPFEFNSIIVSEDFNSDGITDLLVGSDRSLEFAPLKVLLGNGDSTFRDGTSEVLTDDVSQLGPQGITADFNGDGNIDVVIFTAQYFNGGLGSPPVLLLGGSLSYSSAIADAYEAYYILDGTPQFGSDVHGRGFCAGDIDNDGDVDMFVESTGAAEDLVKSHFIVNNGDGTFTIDFDNRVTNDTLQNTSQGEFWRSQTNALVDVDLDGDLDLIVGQGRNEDPALINGRSLVLLNDGTGYFPVADRIMLSLPAFNDGLTTATSVINPDVNQDGLPDLVFAHQGTGGEYSGQYDFAGRFIQVFINLGNGVFIDESQDRIGDQTATIQKESVLLGGTLYNSVYGLAYADIDLDGHQDLIMGRSGADTSVEAPFIHLNDGTGHFGVMDTEIFSGSLSQTANAIAFDANGDGLMDFVNHNPLPGPDDIYGTADDVSNVVVFVGSFE